MLERAGNFFTNVLRCAFNVALQHECAGDTRVALGNLRTQFIETADRVDRLFERKHDLR